MDLNFSVELANNGAFMFIHRIILWSTPGLLPVAANSPRGVLLSQDRELTIFLLTTNFLQSI
jgi:hypothetical protein